MNHVALSVLMLILSVDATPSRPLLPEKGLCAHRGASATHPENTLAAFREAARLGSQMIELDLYLSQDKALIVMHDPTVNRTTNGKGKIADLTLAQIKKLDAGSWKSPKFAGEKVPVFEEALEVMPRNVWLNIHLKEGPEAGIAAARAIVKTDRLHQAFLACDAKTADAARTVAPSIKICNMERQGGNQAYADQTIALKADFIQLAGPVSPGLKEICDKLRQHNIQINYFGVESPEGVRALFQAGVQFPLVNDLTAHAKTAEEFGVKAVK
jgi:glycerophosphoryl diester phosphodiesterase